MSQARIECSASSRTEVTVASTAPILTGGEDGFLGLRSARARNRACRAANRGNSTWTRGFEHAPFSSIRKGPGNRAFCILGNRFPRSSDDTDLTHPSAMAARSRLDLAPCGRRLALSVEGVLIEEDCLYVVRAQRYGARAKRDPERR